MVRFQCKGYITRVFNDKKIKIQIEEEDIPRIENIFNTLYKTKKECSTLNILLQRTVIDIKNIEYEKLEDLVGVYVYLQCFTKYYSFEKKEEFETKLYKGYNVHAMRLRNYTI